MKKLLFISLYFSLCCDAEILSDVGKISNILEHSDPDAKRNVTELITSKGYPAEEHSVQTEDGYILSLVRIPHGRYSRSYGGTEGVVLLIHGDVSDASIWVLDFPHQSLGFILPDNGYDTWLISNRGSRYSKKHIEYSTHEYRFWNYSFDELGKYDVPATIDYILEYTDEDNLAIIGHSRGGAQTFAMLSEMPDYNEKVNLFVAMAPATFLWHITSPVKALVPVAEELVTPVNLVTHGEFPPDNAIIRKIRSEFCTAGKELCSFFLFALGGMDRAQLNETRLGVYSAHAPSSSSTRSILHYAQNIRSKRFRKFDFGVEHNLKYYHQEEPPDYNLTSIKTPVALIWSDNDKLVDPRDIDLLRKSLNSVVFDYRVPYPYNHFDYTNALNAHRLIYGRILHLLSRY